MQYQHKNIKAVIAKSIVLKHHRKLLLHISYRYTAKFQMVWAKVKFLQTRPKRTAYLGLSQWQFLNFFMTSSVICSTFARLLKAITYFLGPQYSSFTSRSTPPTLSAVLMSYISSMSFSKFSQSSCLRMLGMMRLCSCSLGRTRSGYLSSLQSNAYISLRLTDSTSSACRYSISSRNFHSQDFTLIFRSDNTTQTSLSLYSKGMQKIQRLLTRIPSSSFFRQSSCLRFLE